MTVVVVVDAILFQLSGKQEKFIAEHSLPGMLVVQAIYDSLVLSRHPRIHHQESVLVLSSSEHLRLTAVRP